MKLNNDSNGMKNGVTLLLNFIDKGILAIFKEQTNK